MLNRRVIAIYDKDLNGSGKKLAKFGHESYFMGSKDLGDSSAEEVLELLTKLSIK